MAFSDCPYKAYSFLCYRDRAIPNEYKTILDSIANRNTAKYINNLKNSGLTISEYSKDKLFHPGNSSLSNALLTFDDLTAYCPILLKNEAGNCYEPVIFIGSYTASKREQLRLFYIGHILSLIGGTQLLRGKIINRDNRSQSTTLTDCASKTVPIIEALTELMQQREIAPPPLLLNKHCMCCEFEAFCKTTAKEQDALSLLHGISTKKAVSKYEKKGIFTVKQLSYLYKPRKQRKRAKSSTLLHKLELQALAIRTNKIYLINPPTIARQAVEIFLDIEGVPDQNFFYLIGVGISENDSYVQYPFWANTAQEELTAFQSFITKIYEHSETPIYHYGSYESKAIKRLGERYNIDTKAIQTRMVNVNQFIYGKIYFPTYSNSLKDISNFLGFKWTSPGASGLQSIVWRHYWSETQASKYKTLLFEYNKDDCCALKRVVDFLSNIRNRDDIVSDLELSIPGKRCPANPGDVLHQQLRSVLKLSYLDYDKNKISFSENDTTIENKKPAVKKPKPKKKRKRTPTKIVRVRRRVVCPKCGKTPLRESKKKTEKLAIDLRFTKTGVRKTITKYWASKSYCSECARAYNPRYFNVHGHPGFYGRGFKIWIVYQRVALHQTYGKIDQMITDLFDEHITEGRMLDYVKDVADFYICTENTHIKRILKSPYVHVDETPINIYGVNQYVWVFTDGKYVVLQLTKTREIVTANEFLAGYDGVLISDFYSGYDSIDCLHQKCWVHLVRELNNNLWESPFDSEFREFVRDVRDLIVPIMMAVKRYGVRARHLGKFRKDVARFYEQTIYHRHYKSELCCKFQTRFKKYREHLFLFLENDGLPWHNNEAERIVVHLKRQNDISRMFHEETTRNYLRLLGIMKTCQLHKKSFLRFLLSGEKDILDLKNSKKPLRNLRPYDKSYGFR